MLKIDFAQVLKDFAEKFPDCSWLKSMIRDGFFTHLVEKHSDLSF